MPAVSERKRHDLTCAQNSDWKFGPQLHPPVNWKNGFRTQKPTSVVQGLYLIEINSARNRWHYNLRSWILAQVHKSRMTASTRSAKKEKANKPEPNIDNVLQLAGLSKTTSVDTFSPHFVLNTTPNSGSDIGIIETRFYWQLSGKTSSSVAFSELEPCGTESDFRILFSIPTGTPRKFCIDFDGFYPPCYPPGDNALLRLWHPALAVIPKEGDGLRIFNLNSGKKEAERLFQEGIVLEDVTCHENKQITLHCKKASLAKDVLSEFFIFDYPPLQLESHVQVMASVVKSSKRKLKRGRIESGVVFEDFLALQFTSDRTELYDLEHVLVKSKLKEANVRGITHKVTFLPDPLLTLTSEELNHPRHLFFVVTVKQGFQIQELTGKGLYPVLLEDGTVNFFPTESEISFMKTGPIQIIVNHEHNIKVFRVHGGSKALAKTETGSYLKLIFDQSFLDGEEAGKENRGETICATLSASGSAPTRQLRNQPKKTYTQDVPVTVELEENNFLNQVAVVRFAENSLSFYVYDSLTFTLAYKVNVRHFLPKSTEVYDHIEVEFSNQFIAVKRRGSSSTSLYVLNLLADRRSRSAVENFSSQCLKEVAASG